MIEKTELVDSHAHLDMEEFDQDRDQVIERAFGCGIRAILCPADATNPKSLQTTLALVTKYESIIASVAVHPHQAKHFSSHCCEKIRELASAKKIKALGEIGLDFYYNFSSPEKQRETFRSQLNLAQELSLPVVVHSRNAAAEVTSAIKEEHFTRGGVVHCFTEEWGMATQMMNHNFFISFSGILTYPKAENLREIAKKVPLEKLLIETDSPYLVPVPYRGIKKRNEPAYLLEVALLLARLKGISLEGLARATSQNFDSLFVLKNL